MFNQKNDEVEISNIVKQQKRIANIPLQSTFEDPLDIH